MRLMQFETPLIDDMARQAGGLVQTASVNGQSSVKSLTWKESNPLLNSMSVCWTSRNDILLTRTKKAVQPTFASSTLDWDDRTTATLEPTMRRALSLQPC